MKKTLIRSCSALLMLAVLLSGVLLPAMAMQPSDVPLKTSKTTYTEGEAIMITAVGSGSDWVGIYLRDDTLKVVTSILWYYVAMDGNTSGMEKNIFDAEYTNNRGDLVNLPAGEYSVYLLADGGYDVISKVDITITPDSGESTPPSAPASVTYTRTAETVGLADGKLTIAAGEGELPIGYRAYWGGSEGPLAEYTAFAPIACDGETTEYTMVSNTLIPTQADRIYVYSVRKNAVSETASTVLLPEGCNSYDSGAPKYELQVLSDIHINSSNSHLYNQHFAMALADIQTTSPGSIGIFVNGDIADHGREDEYLALNGLIEKAGSKVPPVYCTIGNHDYGQGPNELFLKYTNPCENKPYYDMWLNGAHFIFLGGERAGLHADLSDTQLAWLEEKLVENRDEGRPIYLFLHQGLMDTVAGTFAYQGWHGVKQSEQLTRIIKNYPEIILFSGHSHWEMDSCQTMKRRDENLPTIFNTAAGAYLWDDASTNIEGSQGYYIRVYDDKVLVLGRDFVNGKWISSAQFVVDYTDLSGSENPTNASTQWTFELKNDPTYTITIPSAVTLFRTGTQVDVIAENVANLDGQRICVTIAGTDAYKNQMMLSGVNANGIRQSLRYSITTAGGERIETFGNGTDILGKELASFTKDGTVSFTVAPVITAVEENSSSYKGVTYTGSMTYGIALVGE